MLYNVKEVREALVHLSDIFDVARVVDPVKRRIIVFGSDESIIYEENMCGHVWERQVRCRNCTSLLAYNANRRMTKYEFLNKDIYHVVSKPVDIIYADSHKDRFVLEVVSRITDEVLWDACGKSGFIDKLIAYEDKIYKDSLTKVFNRRYYDEMVFCHNERCELGSKVVFIMADLKKFKLINDIYGHNTGDWVLINAAKAMLSCVRECDSIIRIGGDEFLIVLEGADINIARIIINEIENKMKTDVVYDKQHNKYAVANFGVHCTSDFRDSLEYIQDMLMKADQNLYMNKSKNRCEN
mgnify:CR=1 FL=1